MCLPRQSSQLSQGLKQSGRIVHAGHVIGSVRVVVLQPTLAIRTALLLAPAIWQQPKQSQPLGVAGRQLLKHCGVCGFGQPDVPT